MDYKLHPDPQASELPEDAQRWLSYLGTDYVKNARHNFHFVHLCDPANREALRELHKTGAVYLAETPEDTCAKLNMEHPAAIQAVALAMAAV